MTELVAVVSISSQPEDAEDVEENKKNHNNKRRGEVDARQAWLTLACIFLINANTLGTLKIYGLIFEEIVSQKFYTREQASWPIATASTIQNLAGLLTPLLALRISWRAIEMTQTTLFVLANLGAYFSSNLALDILCLGIIQGVALSLRYNMNVAINNEYFHKYRSTAMGISLAGSTCGVFALKPIISYVLDNSQHQFRNAYLALAVIMSFNILLNLMIRKPRGESTRQPARADYQAVHSSRQEEKYSLRVVMLSLMRNPNIHCIWLMQTIYFYISRTYTIFIVDYGIDKGFQRDASRDLLNFWVYGEIGGRLLLGSLVDAKLISLKWNLILVNLLLAAAGFALLSDPSSFSSSTFYFWFFGFCVASVAALSSLINMMIIPFGQEYLGKKNVPWAFAIGSVITSFFLLLRPFLIGLSRDQQKSYSLLVATISSGPGMFSLLFLIFEPHLKRNRIR